MIKFVDLSIGLCKHSMLKAGHRAPSFQCEIIVNAVCHRNMTDESCVQVAIYDDRLEVTSPGGLYNGLTFEEAMQGRSKLRNRTIANVFSQMGLIEAWGTGLQRIKAAAKEYDLPEPEFVESSDSFRVNLYRKPLSGSKQQNIRKQEVESLINIRDVGENVGDVGEDVGEKNDIVKKNDISAKEHVFNIIVQNNKVSASKIAKEMNIAQRTVERYIHELKAEGRLKRFGSARNGYWYPVLKK